MSLDSLLTSKETQLKTEKSKLGSMNIIKEPGGETKDEEVELKPNPNGD